jgi:hypothetical protein
MIELQMPKSCIYYSLKFEVLETVSINQNFVRCDAVLCGRNLRMLREIHFLYIKTFVTGMSVFVLSYLALLSYISNFGRL